MTATSFCRLAGRRLTAGHASHGGRSRDARVSSALRKEKARERGAASSGPAAALLAVSTPKRGAAIDPLGAVFCFLMSRYRLQYLVQLIALITGFLAARSSSQMQIETG